MKVKVVCPKGHANSLQTSESVDNKGMKVKGNGARMIMIMIKMKLLC